MGELALPEPKNGHEVLHLFSKFHEALGFEKIFGISFLWLDALRNGEKVKVRIRHSSREFLIDYKVADCYGCYVGSRWVKEGGVWLVRNRDGSQGCGVRSDTLPDPDDEYYATCPPRSIVGNTQGALYRKSMKDEVDVLVCWKVDSIVEPGIEVVELSKFFDIKTRQREYYALKQRWKNRINKMGRMRPSLQFLLLLFEEGEIARPDVYRRVDGTPQNKKHMLKRFLERGWITQTRQDGPIIYYGLTDAGRDHTAEILLDQSPQGKTDLRSETGLSGYWAHHDYERLSVKQVVEGFAGWNSLLRIVEAVKGKGWRQQRNQGFLATTFLSGGRCSEVLALRKENFEMRKDENLILVRDMPLLKRYKKVDDFVDEEGKTRWITVREEATRRTFPIVLDEPLVPYMLNWMDVCEDLLFPSPYKVGEPLSRIWAYRLIRRLSDKLDGRIKKRLGFVNRKGEEVAHLFVHWLRGQRASQLVFDYGFEVIDLLDFFTWEKHETALRYARMGWKGLANKMKTKVKYV